ncbi:hypothetical protein BDZ94DRAFT_106351 [Collybia nuda]|uniref:Uncharacterized protein n=1 Tax=Collybia nuda TaxID=64659 RepID=A0A9P5XV89_9AGAR|nr:hypothetical protein BDZ94DRAFT_106351 [Collybia nuda]
MGSAESKSSNSQDYIAATYDTSTVLVQRNESSHYANLLVILHKHFPTIPPELMVIQTKELTICDGRYVNIPEELWTEVCSRIQNINVVSRPVHVMRREPDLPTYDCLRLEADGTIGIKVLTWSCEQ